MSAGHVIGPAGAGLQRCSTQSNPEPQSPWAEHSKTQEPLAPHTFGEGQSWL
jgi:hypothetical protein